MGKGSSPKIREEACSLGSGLCEKIVQTVTLLCGALSMTTGMFVLIPIFHGPLTKRFIFIIPTGGEEQPESHQTQKGTP